MIATPDPPEQHRHLREAVGAFVLGALDGPARRDVEAHLASCADCAVEAADMAPLPGLLNRVSVAEVLDDRLAPDPGYDEHLARQLLRVEQDVQRRLVRWRATALAALAVVAVVAVVAGVGMRAAPEPPLDRVVASVVPVAADAASTRGEAAALAWEWGTTVELDLQDLPVRDTYRLWAVSVDGTREQAGTWGETSGRGARVRGASSIARSELDHVEVTDADGTVLMTFTFPPG